jgi:hypothetical protein
MNRYQPSTPRTLIGIAAFAFATLTIAATVVSPAMTASACAPAALAVIAPDFRMRLDVAGVRESDAAAVQATGPRATRDRQG